jgi:hypothetical protein
MAERWIAVSLLWSDVCKRDTFRSCHAQCVQLLSPLPEHVLHSLHVCARDRRLMLPELFSHVLSHSRLMAGGPQQSAIQRQHFLLQSTESASGGHEKREGEQDWTMQSQPMPPSAADLFQAGLIDRSTQQPDDPSRLHLGQHHIGHWAGAEQLPPPDQATKQKQSNPQKTEIATILTAVLLSCLLVSRDAIEYVRCATTEAIRRWQGWDGMGWDGMGWDATMRWSWPAICPRYSRHFLLLEVLADM